MDKLDLALLVDNSSWTVKSFIDAGCKNHEDYLQTELKALRVDFRISFVKYRDTNKDDRRFIAGTAGFSSNISNIGLQENLMNEALKEDALTAAIDKTYKLDWREDATKVCFIITDSPPSVLCREYKPAIDILEITRKLGGKGVVLNVIGIEPRLEPYKDFFMTLSYKTGGRYIPLTDPSKLVTVIAGVTKEDISLEKILPLIDQKAVECILRIDPSEDDVGKFYNGCDQHFNDFYKDIKDNNGIAPQTYHFMESYEVTSFASSLARYLTSLTNMDDLKKICQLWPLPWPVLYQYYPLPPLCPPPSRVEPPPPPPHGPPISHSTCTSPVPAPPPPPAPMAPAATSLPSPESRQAREPNDTVVSVSSGKIPKAPPLPPLPKSATAQRPSTAPPPPLLRTMPPPTPRIPPPPVNSEQISLTPPPPPPPLPRHLPLIRQWPPNPREPPPSLCSQPAYRKIDYEDAVGRPPLPFDGAFCFRKQCFGLLRSHLTYGQVHRMVQRVLVRGLVENLKQQ